MKSKPRIELFRVPTLIVERSEYEIKYGVSDSRKESKDFLAFTLSFREGGTNWFYGTTEAKGYELNLTALQVRQTYKMSHLSLDGSICGGRALIEETKRFSQKRFDAVNETLTFDHQLVQKLLRHCLNRTPHYKLINPDHDLTDDKIYTATDEEVSEYSYHNKEDVAEYRKNYKSLVSA